MLNLNRVARRKAGLAAALVVAGGLAGAAVLAPGTAFAGPMQVSTTTAITGTQQSSGWNGMKLAVSIAVSTPTGSPLAPAGYVTISDGSATCRADLTAPSSGLTSTGSCAFYGLNEGNYQLSATYNPSTMQFGSSKDSSYWVQVGHHRHSSLSTWLKCPQRVNNGSRGTCTLYVTDNGANSQGSVSAAIALPGALHATGCSLDRSWWGCSISRNVAYAHLGSLRAGQTKALSVTFKGNLPGWGWQRTHAERVSVHGFAQDSDSRSSSSATVTVFPRFFW
jgi:hypothetical protein